MAMHWESEVKWNRMRRDDRMNPYRRLRWYRLALWVLWVSLAGNVAGLLLALALLARRCP